MFSAVSVCLFVNTITSERLDDDETRRLGALYKDLTEFGSVGHIGPRSWVPTPQNVAFYESLRIKNQQTYVGVAGVAVNK